MQAYEAAPVGLCMLGPDLHIVRMNARLADIIGVSTPEATGRTLREVAPLLAEAVEPVCTEMLHASQPCEEREVMARSGEESLLLVSCRPLLGERDRVLGLTVVVQEARAGKTAVVQEWGKLRSLAAGLQAAGIGVDIVGRDYRVISQNDLLTERFGDLTGQVCHKGYMDRDEPCEACPLREALDEGRIARAEMTGADGREYEVLAAPMTGPDGTAHSAVEVVQDITERKQAEKERQASQEMLDTAFRSNPHAMYIAALADGRFIEVNEGFERIAGYSREEIVGKTSLELGLLADPDRGARLREMLERDGCLRDVETDIIDKSGNVRTVLLSGERIDLHGQPHHLGVATDITDRKRGEDELGAQQATPEDG
jgi:PAS domain S-box-containing protein